MHVTTLRELLPGADGLPEDLLAAMERTATRRSVAPTDTLLRQRAVVDELIVLAEGQVSTYVQFSGAGDLVVETATQPGRIYGWSGLRHPNRATATVRADTEGKVVAIPLAVVREGPPAWTAATCRLVAAALAERIGAVAQSVDDAERDLFAHNATWVTLGTGDALYAADDPADALWLLVDGVVHVGCRSRAGDDADVDGPDGIAVRAISTPGYPLGWDAFVTPNRHRWHAVAASRSRVLRIERRVLDEHCANDDEASARVHRWMLWLAGAQLRAQHTRLVARRYDDEIDAVSDLIADRAPNLRATSALHRVPGYLRSRPTVADAFRVLEAVRDGDTAAEATVARQSLELLDGVRRELQVYLGMQRVYESVASAPAEADPAQVRAASCRALIDLFALTRYRIVGLERLPEHPGSIVLSNHLWAHPNNRLPNGFLIILDVHFVSSMVLYRTYGRAPVRVVRDSHWDEAGHVRYYSRLGYVMVPSYQVDPLPPEQREQRRRRFVAQASEVLRSGTDLVICPEGRTGPTHGSPQRLRIGAFMLAAEIDPEPPIVPVALANFDERMTNAHLGAVVGEPFRMSEVVDDPTDRAQVTAFVNEDLQPRYREWVSQAAGLR